MTRVAFVTLLDKLGSDKHTGSVVLHFAGGVPRSAEILRPSERIALDVDPAVLAPSDHAPRCSPGKG